MNIRQIIQAIVSLLIIAGAIIFFKKITKEKEPETVFVKKVVQSVATQVVKNNDIKVEINTSGKLSAKNKIDLFAEVQGVFQRTNKDFKSGVKYYKGETLIKINSSEFYSAIKAKRAALQNMITALMPDLKIDFSEDFPKWKAYLNSYDVNSTLKALPKFNSEKEKYFIASKNISVKYFEIKNLEEKLKKFYIKAPFSGVITQANVNVGAVVNPGQRLGQFIDPSIYELEISLSNDDASLLKVGDKVNITNMEETKNWQGKVVRKNAVIEQVSQTKKVFIQLKDQELSDGMYLKANIKGNMQKQVYEIDRSLMVEDKFVYIVENRTLKLKEVTPIHFSEKTALVKGLLNGEIIISKVVPGAYEGMEVKVISAE